MKLALYRIWQVCIMAPIMIVATILTALLTLAGSTLGGGRWWGYYPEIIWSRLMCWLNFVTVSATGHSNISPSKSYVFVCNHQGAFDIFSIYGWLGHNFRWMMKAPLRKIPLVGFACAKSHQIFVDNSSPAAVRRTMADAERILSRGMSVTVFPEGARTPDGHMHTFKKGAYRLAMEFNLPVVPVTIDGAYHVMPRQHKMPLWGHINITIHEPIHPSPTGHDLKELMAKSEQIIASAL